MRTSRCDKEPTALPTGAALSWSPEDVRYTHVCCREPSIFSVSNWEGVEQAWPGPVWKAELCVLGCTAVIRELGAEAVLKNL